MKRSLFLLALLLHCGAMFAQVAINNDGTIPDPSAGLDVKFTDKGLLIPRISLVNTTSALPVTSPAISLLVYNTSTTGDVSPGYYFWSGSAWVRLSASTSGSGTTNYVTKWTTDGTLGNSQLFDNGTNVGIGTTTPGAKLDVAGRIWQTSTGHSVFIGESAGAADDLSDNQNVFLGYQAGNANTSGMSNVAIGTGSLYNNTTRKNLVAVGDSALFNNGLDATENDHATANAAIGSKALFSNTTGYRNTAGGYLALFSNTSASENTAYGYAALMNSNYGAINTAIGSNALYSNISGTGNTANGSYALYSNTGGNTNTAYGLDALYTNLYGSDNTANGYGALYYNLGSYNTANGYYSLWSNITGLQNTALGYFADVASGSLTNATAIGARAMAGASNSLVLGSIAGVNYATTTVKVGIGTSTPTARLDIVGAIKITDGTQGVNKILTSDANGLASWQTPAGGGWSLLGNAGTVAGANFIGTIDSNAFDIRTNNLLRTRITTKGAIETYNTGRSVFIGEGAGAADDLSDNQNVFVGYQAGKSNLTGYYNVANGFQALYSNTDGYANTANGWRSLYFNTTGDYNTANGSFTLYANTEGSINIANGPWALSSNTTGNYNTANGWSALYTNITGNSNTAIGFYADVASSDLSNATAIGANAIAGASNSLVLGNNAYVGIGTSTPNAKLHVNEGNFLVSGAYGGGDNIPASGVGTRMFFYPKKAAFRAGFVNSTEWDDENIGLFSTALGYGTTANGYYSIATGYGSTASGFYSTAMGRGTTANGDCSTAMGLYTTASGYYSTTLGLYTIASGYYSTALGNYTTASGDNSTALGERTFAKSGYETVIGRWNSDYTPVSTADWNANDRLFSIGNGTASDNRSDAMTVLKNGNVGIGTTSPDFKTQIAQDITMNNEIEAGSGQLALTSSSDPDKRMVMGYDNTGNGFGFIKTANRGIAWTNLVLLPNGGNVGIGTSTSGRRLDVNGVTRSTTSSGSDNANGQFQARAGGTANSQEAVYSFYPTFENTPGDIQPRRAADILSGFNAGNWGYQYLAFHVGNNMSSNDGEALTIERMRITGSGDVGIGTTSPSQKLDVDGNARFRSIGSGVSAGAVHRTSDGTLTTSTSDIRLKTNIETINNGLERVMKLRGVTFNWKEVPDNSKMIGFIAQEVEQAVPELVFTNPVDGYKGVNYGEMTAVLVEAVKQQQNMIEELSNQNRDLKSANAELNKKLETMQAQIDVINGYLGVSAVK